MAMVLLPGSVGHARPSALSQLWPRAGSPGCAVPAGYGLKLSNPRMDAFWRMVGEHADERPFAGYRIIAVQHLLGSTGGLLRAFVSCGARPQDITVVGKSYSEHGGVIGELRADGFDVRRSRRGYSRDVGDLVKMVLAEARRHPGRKFLVIGDGGKLIRRLEIAVQQHDAPPNLARRIFAVEQTTRGPMTVRRHNTFSRRVTAVAAIRYGTRCIAPETWKELRRSKRYSKVVARIRAELGPASPLTPALLRQLKVRPDRSIKSIARGTMQEVAFETELFEMLDVFARHPERLTALIRVLREQKILEKPSRLEPYLTRRNWTIALPPSLSFSAVRTATAPAKRKLESPSIGRSVARSILHQARLFGRLGLGGYLPASNTKVRVLMVGDGAVGSHSADSLLQLGYDVAVLDPKYARAPLRLRRALQRGLTAFSDKAEALRFNPRILVQAVGKPVLEEQDYAALGEGTMIVNAASCRDQTLGSIIHRMHRVSVREDKVYLRFNGRAIRVGEIVPPGLSRDLVYDATRVGRELSRIGGRDRRTGEQRRFVIRRSVKAPWLLRAGSSGPHLLLARGGHPINFGTVDPIPSEYIQLTRGLLFLSALQTIKERRPGWHRLSSAPQRRFVRSVEADLRALGRGSLRRPTF
jgi:hypothetical protein